MKHFLICLAFVLTLFLTACAIDSQPKKFSSCATLGDDPQTISFNAIIESLNSRRGWQIKDINPEKFEIVAEVSGSRLPVGQDLSITVMDSGEVVFQTPIKMENWPHEKSWYYPVNRWLEQLEEIYSRKRCTLKGEGE